MRKHTWPAVMVALAIVFAGFWGSMQNVSANDTIKVLPLGKGETNTAKSTGALKSSKNDSSSSIVIEVVKDSDNSNSSTSQSERASKNGAIAGISYDELVMANVEEAVNIRDSASENGKLIGKFYKECAGTILEKSNGWTKLTTGDVTGWVKNDYLLFGDAAVELAEKVVEKTATCNTDCLRVRKSADPNGTVLDLLAEGDQIGVLGTEGDWVKVEYSDGETGFVSSEFVTIADSLDSGKSIEFITEQEEAEKKARAEAVAASKEDKIAENASKETKTEASSEVAVATQTAGTAAGYSDVVLLAALIQAESGTQPYEGQVAVGNVVVNRLATGKYGSSIYSVIYAKSQFGPAGSGQVAKIAAAGPKAICLQAAQDALNGVNYVGTATHFRNVNSGYQGIVIGAHVFW